MTAALQKSLRERLSHPFMLPSGSLRNVYGVAFGPVIVSALHATRVLRNGHEGPIPVSGC